MRDMIAIDVQGVEDESVAGLYDEFCNRGYTLPSGYAPEYEEVVEDFVDIHGTSPAYMFCYENDDGYGIIEFTTSDSRKAARMLDGGEPMDFDRALHRYGFGY